MASFIPSFLATHINAAKNDGAVLPAERNPLTADAETANSSSNASESEMTPTTDGEENGNGHNGDHRTYGAVEGVPACAAGLEMEQHADVPLADTEEGGAGSSPKRLGRQRSHSFLFEESIKGRVPLAHTQSASFWEDAKEFQEGTIPQSIVIATVIGIVCGVAAYVYYTILFFLLDFVWHTLPQKFVIGVWSSENVYVVWIPLMGFSMAILVGLSVRVLGEPGDLAYTIKCVHDKAYISMSHVLPMVAASQFSILGGGSLGPEAPLVAICAALGGFISRKVFKQTNRNVVRKHTLMGMAGALAAFFGCPLGGSLFALEVNSRFGVEYFEHMVEAIFCGEVCVAVFRGLCRLPIEAIWTIALPKMESASPLDLVTGAAMGLLGAGIAALFAAFHWRVMDAFDALGLFANHRAVQRALLGSTVIVALGMMIPHTMFWGESEFQTISTMAPASELENIWPTAGVFGFEMDSGWHAILVAVGKLLAISFTVAGGYRGGFIFPFFAAGAAFGRAFVLLFPQVPVALACLCFAAGINVAITRTSLATPLILCYLAGEPCAISGVLAASLVSLFATSYMPFIKTQSARNDLGSSLFHVSGQEPLVHSASEHAMNSSEHA